MKRIYLDYNATALMHESVRTQMVSLMGRALNPSSIHQEGRRGRKVVEEARHDVAELVGADPKAITFTAGGTEANNTVLVPELQIGSREILSDRLYVSAIEHPCVLGGGRFTSDKIFKLPVTHAGVLDLQALRTEMKEGGSPFISVMLANNETGVIQPIEEIAEIVHDAGGMLHVDAVQAAGKIPIDMETLQADFLTLSAHKIGGPQGVGAIVGATAGHRFRPLNRGGRQELGLRAGTENVAAIAGFGEAAKIAKSHLEESEGPGKWTEILEAELKYLSNEIVIFGESANRLPNTTNFAVPGKRAETLVIAYDMAGIAISSGSACSSGKVGGSHVLEAMGVSADLCQSAIRVSTGWQTTREDVDRFIATSAKILAR